MTVSPAPTYCANHPGVETSLRCNRCDKPICSKCAVKSPVGYRCPECVRSQQKAFDTSLWYDYISAFAAAAVTSAFSAVIITLISGFFFGMITLAVAPLAAQVITRAVQLFIKNRRSKNLFITASAGVVAGALPVILTAFLGLLAGSFLPFIWLIIYLVVAVPSVYTQLSGIQLFK